MKTASGLIFRDPMILVSCLFLSLALPLTYNNSTIDPVLLPRLLTLGLTLSLLLAFMLLGFRSNNHMAPLLFWNNRIVYTLLASVIISLLSLSKAINISEGMADLLKMCAGIIWFLVLIYILQTRSNAQSALFKAILVCGSIFIISGFYQFIREPDFDIHSLNANRNLFSSALLFTLPFVIYGGCYFSGKWRIIAFLLLISSAFFIIIIQTRAVWISLAISVPLVFTFVLFDKRSRETLVVFLLSRKYQVLATILVICLISLFVFKSKFQEHKDLLSGVDPVKTSTFSGFFSSHGRLTIWGKTMQMIHESPVLGVGMGNWKINLPKYGISDIATYPGDQSVLNGTTHFLQPHNDFLWIWAETGTGGLIACLLLFAFAIHSCVVMGRKSELMEDKILGWLLLGGISVFFINSFFDFPRERIEHQVLFMSMLAFLVVKTKQERVEHLPAPTSGFGLVIISLFALTLFTLHINWSRYRSEKQEKKVVQYHATEEWESLIRAAEQAYSPNYTLDPFVAPVRWYEGVANFSLGRTDEALMNFLQAYKDHPYHLHVLNNIGTCYEVKGDHQHAIEFYLKALTVSPAFRETRLNLCAAYFNAGKIKEAFLSIQLAKPDLSNSVQKNMTLTILHAVMKDDILRNDLSSSSTDDESLLTDFKKLEIK